MASRTAKPLPPVPGSAADASSSGSVPIPRRQAPPGLDFASQLQQRVQSMSDHRLAPSGTGVTASPVNLRKPAWNNGGNAASSSSSREQRFSMQTPLPKPPSAAAAAQKRHTVFDGREPRSPPHVPHKPNSPPGLKPARHPPPPTSKPPPAAKSPPAAKPPPAAVKPRPPPATAKPTKGPPPPLKPKRSVESYPAEDLYEDYDKPVDGDVGEEFYEEADEARIEEARQALDARQHVIPVDHCRPLPACPSTSAKVTTAGTEFTSKRKPSFSEPPMFPAPLFKSNSFGMPSNANSRGPISPTGEAPRKSTPKPLPKPASALSPVNRPSPPPAAKPKPPLKKKSSAGPMSSHTVILKRDSFSSASEPNSPKVCKASSGRGPVISKLSSSGHHGSMDSLPGQNRSSVADITARVSQCMGSNRPVPPPAAGRPSPGQSKPEQTISPPSIPIRGASRPGGKAPRQESGIQDDLYSETLDRADSPFMAASPQHQSPVRHQVPRVKSLSPDSAMGRSRESPVNNFEPYDDVVVVVPYPASAGPIRPSQSLPAPPPVDEEEHDEMSYDSVEMMPADVARRLKPDNKMGKRVVDRQGPRASHFGGAGGGVPPSAAYQSPDRQSVTSEEYMHLHNAWTEAPDPSAGSHYEFDADDFDDSNSVYEAPHDEDGMPAEEQSYAGMTHLDVQCRAATMRVSKGYLEEASSGLPPPGEPPSELFESQQPLADKDLYSDGGRMLYQDFIKTGLDAVRFGRFPACIAGKPRLHGLRRMGSDVSTSSGNEKAAERQYQYVQLVILHEEIYNYTLTQMVERFIKARELSPDLPDDLRVVNKVEAKALFNNVKALLDVSTRLLSGLRRRQRVQGADIESVSDMFNFMLSDSLSKLYLTHCTNYVYQVRKLEELSKDNSQFSRSLAILEMDKSLGSHDLASFFAVPTAYITYLPKYLQALTENLAPQAVSLEVKAAEAAKLVGRWCDEAAQTVNRTEQLVRTEHQLGFEKVKHIALVSQSRRLIRSGPIKLVDTSNPSAPHRQDYHLLVFNDLVMLARPRGLKSAMKLRRSDKTLKVVDWSERRLVDVNVDEEELLHFPDHDQEKTLKGGLMQLRNTVRKEAALDTSLAFKLMWESDSSFKEYLLEPSNLTDRERWMTALDDESSRCGRAVEAIYEDAEMSHYEVVADHMAVETDELALTTGNTVVVRRKTPDGWCFGEDLLTGRVGWFQLLYCRPV